MNKNIFISYIEEDREYAEYIAKKLLDEGFSPWAYTINGSFKWKKQIYRELKQCEIMILVFSKKTNDKADKQIVKELGLASQFEKEIIPFMIDKITPNDITNEEIAYEIVGGSITWIDKEEPFEKQVETLICRVKKYYGVECSTKIQKNNKNIPFKSQKRQMANWWKSIIGILSIFLLVGLGYFAYTNLTIGEKNNLGVLLELESDELKDKINENNLLSTNEDPSKFKTLMTNNKGGTRWLSSVNVRAGDRLGFNIHYYGWHKGINDLNIKIDNLDGRTFKEDEEITVNAVVSSKNLKPSYGQVKVIFDEPVKLKLYHISWQKNKCQSFQCETPLPENAMSIFSDKGLNLGDLYAKDNEDYYGNVVVSYDVIKMQESSDLIKVTPYKASMISPSKIPPLVIAKKTNDSFTKWSLSQDLKVGDIVALELHIYANKAPLQNIKIKLANITNSVFEADSSVQVSSLVTARGVAPLKGSVSMQFLEKAKLVYWKYKWAIKKENSFNTETVKKLPNSQKGSDVFNEGIKLGSLPQGYRSNLILYFWVKGV